VLGSGIRGQRLSIHQYLSPDANGCGRKGSIASNQARDSHLTARVMLLWRSSELRVNDTVQGFGSGILGLDWWAGQRVAVQVAEVPGSKSACHRASTAGGRSLSLKAQHHSAALAAIRSPKPSHANKSLARERLQSIKRALARTSSRLQPSMEGPVAARRPTKAMDLVARSDGAFTKRDGPLQAQNCIAYHC
jgi:hypothetical protein